MRINPELHLNAVMDTPYRGKGNIVRLCKVCKRRTRRGIFRLNAETRVNHASLAGHGQPMAKYGSAPPRLRGTIARYFSDCG